MDRKNSIFFLLFTLFVLLSWIFAGCSSTALMTRTTVRERPDSILVHTPPLQISASSDSLCLMRSPLDSTAVRSLVAAIDTTIGGTHVMARYALSAKRGQVRDNWHLRIAPKDTMVHYTAKDSLTEIPYEVEVIPFWVKAVLVFAIIALLIALLKK
jgi:hypothetical protein